jgi:hypothetical protein
MVKTFVYAKADGTVGKRTVFVMAEDASYIRGLDFAHLSEDEQKKVQKNLANHKVADTVTFGKGDGHKIEGFDDAWKVLSELSKKKTFARIFPSGCP